MALIVSASLYLIIRQQEVKVFPLGEQGHAIHHEAGQMVRRRTVTQAHSQIERLGVVHGFERSTHVLKYPLFFYNSG
jgi:hypothetical protein